MATGQFDRVLILDVDGTRLVIDAPEYPDQPGQPKVEVHTILDSIKIAPAVSASPGPS